MIIWIDEHLSRRLAPWIKVEFGVDAVHVSDLNLSAAPDPLIFAKAREANAVLLTKDFDFIILLERYGPPPRLMWLTTGNRSTRLMKTLLARRLPAALALLNAGESVAEIGG